MTHNVKNLHLLSRNSFINSLADIPAQHTHLDISGNNLSKRSRKALMLAFAKIPAHIKSIDISNNKLESLNNLVMFFLHDLPDTIDFTITDGRKFDLKEPRLKSEFINMVHPRCVALKTIRFFDFLEIIENTYYKYKDSGNSEAVNAAQILLKELNDLEIKMFEDDAPMTVVGQKFKLGCIAAIEKSRAVLEKYDDWKTILTDFIHHIVAFCTFGKVQMNHYNFFSDTHSKQKVDEFISNLDNPVLGVSV